MRVFVPSSLPNLRTVLFAGELPPVHGYATTPGMREWYAAGDEEEIEYLALVAAARESLRLLAREKPGPPMRRVVLALDAPDVVVTVLDVQERGLVALRAPVSATHLISALADDADAETTVAAAVEAVTAADVGDAEALLAVEEADDIELSWYARQELELLVG
ncbi:MAG: DUF6912 family protein [Frankiaceae bacterium]